MAIKLITVKCPECGAVLDIEEGRNQFFCSYCGAKVLLNNENEHIYRHIDEARIKEIENEKIIKMRELDISEKQALSEDKYIKYAFIVALALLLLGVILAIFGSETIGTIGAFLMVIALNIGIYTYIHLGTVKKNRATRANIRAGKIKLPDISVKGKMAAQYKVVYDQLGFNNITMINLKDIQKGSINILTKPGSVQSITINGENPHVGGWYDSDAAVVISYHDKSE